MSKAKNLKVRSKKPLKVKVPKKPPLSPEERFDLMRINFVSGKLRKASLYWPPIRKALDAAFAGRYVNKFSGRPAKHYYCAHCLCAWPMSKINRDHIVPVGKKGKDWAWIDRLLCQEENIQILCENCHSVKTQSESIIGYV